MLTVSDLLSRKGNKTVSVHPNYTVYQALHVMADYDVGAVLVIDRRIVGHRDDIDILQRGFDIRAELQIPIRQPFADKIFQSRFKKRRKTFFQFVHYLQIKIESRDLMAC